MKRVYILVAEGFEAVETLAPIDVLHRAGVEVVRVAVGGSLRVASSHNLVSLDCDVLIEECHFDDCDALVLPGGNPGYVNLCNSDIVRGVVKMYYENGTLIAAICGAPTVLAAAGVASGAHITCHSTVVDQMCDYCYDGGSVVEDGNILTAAGAGVSIAFALALLARIVDPETYKRTLRSMEV